MSSVVGLNNGCSGTARRPNSLLRLEKRERRFGWSIQNMQERHDLLAKQTYPRLPLVILPRFREHRIGEFRTHPLGLFFRQRR